MIFSSGGTDKGNVKKKKKDAHMIICLKLPPGINLLKREQNYFKKLFREQERKGEIFMTKPRVKTTFNNNYYVQNIDIFILKL
jgi:hypothetical protein